MKKRRGVFALLVTGIVGMIAIGASSASAAVNSTSTTTLGIHAFVDNGFSGSIVGVPGAAVGLNCVSNEVRLAFVGTASNGAAKANYFDEGSGFAALGSGRSPSVDDLDNTDTLSLNLFNNAGTDFREVTGHGEFVNGAQNRTLTIQYSTEDTPDNTTADCAVWGSAVKGLG